MMLDIFDILCSRHCINKVRVNFFCFFIYSHISNNCLIFFLLYFFVVICLSVKLRLDYSCGQQFIVNDWELSVAIRKRAVWVYFDDQQIRLKLDYPICRIIFIVIWFLSTSRIVAVDCRRFDGVFCSESHSVVWPAKKIYSIDIRLLFRIMCETLSSFEKKQI